MRDRQPLRNTVKSARNSPCGNSTPTCSADRDGESKMRLDRSAPAGTVHRLTLESTVLAGNFLGDPTARLIDVYVPQGHDRQSLPFLVDLVGFTAGRAGRRHIREVSPHMSEQEARPT